MGQHYNNLADLWTILRGRWERKNIRAKGWDLLNSLQLCGSLCMTCTRLVPSTLHHAWGSKQPRVCTSLRGYHASSHEALPHWETICSEHCWGKCHFFTGVDTGKSLAPVNKDPFTKKTRMKCGGSHKQKTLKWRGISQERWGLGMRTTKFIA